VTSQNLNLGFVHLRLGEAKQLATDTTNRETQVCTLNREVMSFNRSKNQSNGHVAVSTVTHSILRTTLNAQSSLGMLSNLGIKFEHNIRIYIQIGAT
jgi:hypothetical protein